MVETTDPWFGEAQPTQQPVEQAAPVERRRPQEEKALNAALVLAGLRGAKEQHAVRFRDLERLEEGILSRFTPAVRAQATKIADQIAAQQAAINAESKQLVTRLEGVGKELLAEVAKLGDAEADLTVKFNKALGDVQADLEENYYTITDADEAIAAKTLNLTTQINTVSAHLSNNYYTKAAADQAIAGQINTFETNLGGNFVNVQTFTSSINGIEGTHGVSIDNNGHVSGYGLISALRDGGAVADFVIKDAAFRLVNTSGQGDYTPFAVYPSGRTIDGAFVPPGIHASDLYVTRGNIAHLAVDTLQIADNAVVIPTTGTGVPLSGNGGFQTSVNIALNLPVTSNVLLLWSFRQGYSATVPTWGYQLRSGPSGSIYEDRDGMTFGTDHPSGQKLLTNRPAGTFNATLMWKGQNADISAVGTLTVIVVMK
jgi:hypothetical protein